MAIHAEDPSLFRAVNIGLHGLNGFLLFLFLQRIAGSATGRARPVWPEAAASLLFLLHPLQSEAVIYIYQRSSLLSLTFALLALHAGFSRAGRLNDVLLLASLLGALLSKEWTIVLPLVVWLERGLLRDDWRFRLPLCAGALLSLAGAAGMWFWMAEDPTLGSGSPWAYARLQTLIWWKYLRLIVVPWGQSIDHPLPLPGSGPGVALLAAAGLGAGGLLAIRLCRRVPGAVFGLSFFVLALLPTSSFIPAQDAIFEHRLYAPLAGLAILVGRVLARFRRSWSWKHLGPAGAALVASLSLLTLARSSDWRSQESLWEEAVRIAPNSYRSRLNLGRLQMETSPESAQLHLSRAIELRPELPHAFRSLAAMKARLGDQETAGRLYQQAILLAPSDAATHFAFGRLRADQLRYFEAREEFQRAIELDPDELQSYQALARLESSFGFQEQALAAISHALRIRPDDGDLLHLRAEILVRMQRLEEAAETIEHALANGNESWNSLVLAGRIAQSRGEASGAGDFFRRSLEAARDGTQAAISRQLLEDLKAP